MKTSKIHDLIRLVEKSDIDELEVSSWGKKVRIRKKISGNGNSNGSRPQVVQSVPDKVIEVETKRETAPKAVEIPPEVKEEHLEIKSPMVGTFYRSPAPDAKPYVDVGQKVSRGQVVCIIEAMKIMNEIESEFDGVVAEIPASDAQPVQFGQPLILIKPA